MTLILLAPISVSVTVNSVFSSTGAAAAPPPPPIGIAIGIAAAADTPSSDLERLHELRQLEHADSLDVVDHLLLRHFGHCLSLLDSASASVRRSS